MDDRINACFTLKIIPLFLQQTTFRGGEEDSS